MRLSNVVIGDIDHNGEIEAVAITSFYAGGTGVFKSLVLVKQVDGEAKVIQRIGLGDRTAIEDVRIDDGLVILNLLTHDSGEPSCCPNTPRKDSYRLLNGNLVKTI